MGLFRPAKTNPEPGAAGEPDQLPDGHDDERSPFHVPQELREFYRPDPKAEAAAYYQGDARDRFVFDLDRAAEIADWDNTLQRISDGTLDLDAGPDGRDIRARDRAEERARWLRENPQRYKRMYVPTQQPPRDLDEHELALFHHTLRLDAATKQHAKVSQRRQVEAKWRADKTCQVCGGLDLTTTGRTLDGVLAEPIPNLGTGVASTAVKGRYCEACAVTVAAKVADQARAHQMEGGRTRGQVVDAWLEQYRSQ